MHHATPHQPSTLQELLKCTLCSFCPALFFDLVPHPGILSQPLLTISLSSAAVSVLLSGVPCPIVIAWAIGKLYYENEQ